MTEADESHYQDTRPDPFTARPLHGLLAITKCNILIKECN